MIERQRAGISKSRREEEKLTDNRKGGRIACQGHERGRDFADPARRLERTEQLSEVRLAILFQVQPPVPTANGSSKVEVSPSFVISTDRIPSRGLPAEGCWSNGCRSHGSAPAQLYGSPDIVCNGTVRTNSDLVVLPHLGGEAGSGRRRK